MYATKIRTEKELEKAFGDATNAVKTATVQALEAAVDKTAKEVTKQTRDKSPRRTGVYAKGWKSRKTEGRVGTYGREVFQKEKPGLAHLLEDGHEIKGAERFRKNKTRTDAFPHITKDDEAEKMFVDNLTTEVEKELGKI